MAILFELNQGGNLDLNNGDLFELNGSDISVDPVMLTITIDIPTIIVRCSITGLPSIILASVGPLSC